MSMFSLYFTENDFCSYLPYSNQFGLHKRSVLISQLLGDKTVCTVVASSEIGY